MSSPFPNPFARPADVPHPASSFDEPLSLAARPAYGVGPPLAQPRVRTRRGRTLSWAALASVAVVSLTLAVSAYATLASIHLVSLDVFGTALEWLVVFGVFAAIAPIVVILAIVAVCYARPRGVAAVALLCSIVVPVAASTAAFSLGAAAFKANVAADVDEHGGDAVRTVVGALDRANVDIGPVREFLLGLVGAEG